MSELKELRKQMDAIDCEMIRLFEKRMETAEAIGEYKKQNGISVDDPAREEEMIRRNEKLVSRKWRSYYRRFQKYLFKLSKAHQRKLLEKESQNE